MEAMTSSLTAFGDVYTRSVREYQRQLASQSTTHAFQRFPSSCPVPMALAQGAGDAKECGWHTWSCGFSHIIQEAL